jgi:hypothetical protein
MVFLVILVALLLVWSLSVPGFEDYRALLGICFGIALFLHVALRSRVRPQ